MVSADNLNLDVLEVIFAYLSGNDLPSVALVSRSFLAGVIPRLYGTLSYRVRQGKGYNAGKVISPFGVLLVHPELAIHVRKIEIRSVPMISSQPHSGFIRECTNALKLCRNLKSFVCTVRDVLHYFILPLQDKNRLESLRVFANLTTDQAEILVKLTKISDLTLEHASWNTVHFLPTWAQMIQRNLTSLTLYMINELNEPVLESTIIQLPSLRGLHVVGCPKIDHIGMLRLISNTPLLESLSMTTTENQRSFDTPMIPLHSLHHLSLDVKYTSMGLSTPTPSALGSLLTHLRLSSPPLISFVIKFPERKIVIGHPIVKQILDGYAYGLRRLAFLNCGVGMDSIREVSKSCLHLERFDVAVPVKEITVFTTALSRSHTLRTLVDVDDYNHTAHGLRLSITPDNARHLMANVRNLRTIISDNRIWTGRRGASNNIIVSLERQSTQPPSALWFMPHE